MHCPTLFTLSCRALLASLLGSSENLMSPTYRQLLSEGPSGGAELRSSGGGASGPAAADGGSGAPGSSGSGQGQRWN